MPRSRESPRASASLGTGGILIDQASATQPWDAAVSQAGDTPVGHVRVRWIVMWLVLGTFIIDVAKELRGGSSLTPDDWSVITFHGVIAVWILRQRHTHALSLRSLCGPFSRDIRGSLPMLAGACFALVSLGLQQMTQIAVGRENVVLRWGGQEVLPWHSPMHMALAAGMLLIVAPITEELIFRGILLNRWARVFSIGTAAALSACLFGLLHDAFLWGVCFALLMTTLSWRTGGLWTSIGAHSLQNATGLAWYAVQRAQEHTSPVTATTAGNIRVPLAAFILGATGLVIILRWILPARRAGSVPGVPETAI
jgi:uncharacterized protein